VYVNDVVVARCDSVVEEIRSEGGSASAVCFDVTDWHGVRSSIESLDRLDVLVNNAGNRGDGGFELKAVVDSDPADWEPFLRVNLHGVMLCTRAALPAMVRAEHGRVITLLSDAARVGDPNLAAYAAAKAGAAGFIRSVAAEVGRFGITANCIALGTMRTPLTGLDLEQQNPELVRSLLRDYLIRRRGEPEDVAGLVTLLASEHGAWITGQTIPVNGGRSMAL
jgi:NAD(P)-dependent dehydrogenase (short-subunit alcohol dehydrogenase family)